MLSYPHTRELNGVAKHMKQENQGQLHLTILLNLLRKNLTLQMTFFSPDALKRERKVNDKSNTRIKPLYGNNFKAGGFVTNTEQNEQNPRNLKSSYYSGRQDRTKCP